MAKARIKREDLDRFLDILKIPFNERSDSDIDFSKAFSGQWFKGKPEYIIAKDSNDNPGLWGAYKQWLLDKKEQRTREKLVEKPDEPGDGTPGTAIGDMISTLDARGRANDEQISKMLQARENPNRWVGRARKAAVVTMAGVTLTAGYLGISSALKLKKAAEDTGGKVQDIQQKVGKDAEKIGLDPHAPLNSLEGRDGQEQKNKEQAEEQEQGKNKSNRGR